MHRRILNIYLVREQDQLSLRFIEVQRKEEEREDEPAHWRRIRDTQKPRFDRVWDEVHNKMNFEYVEYCTGPISRDIGITESRSILNYHREPHEYNEVIMPLSTNPALLLRQLGPLDGAIFYYQEFNKQNGCTVHFPLAPVDFSSQQDIMYSSFSTKDDGEKPKQSMSRSVANWILSEVEKNPAVSQNYQGVLPDLREILASESSSLAYPVIQKYYPHYDFEDSRVKTCLEADPLKTAMFAADTDYEEKEKLILTWLKTTLNPRPGFFAFFSAKPTNVKSPKQEIDDWFANMKVIQKHMWYKKIESLTGQLSYEGGPYVRSHNFVINFLRDADLHFNESGLMELDVSKLQMAHSMAAFDVMQDDENGDTLKKPEFEHEVRHACKLLGLEFIPGQDFYKSFRYAFTPESTKKLMDWGFHITKEHCKRLFKAAHDYAGLEMFLRHTEGLPTVLNDLKLAIMKSAEPYLPPEDLQSMYRFRNGPR